MEACFIGDWINTGVLVDEATVVELLDDSPVVFGTPAGTAAATAAAIAFEPNKFRRAGEGGGTPPFCGIEMMGEPWIPSIEKEEKLKI